VLILEPRKNPSFDVVFNVSTPHQWFACAHLPDPHLPRSYAVTFPKRSLPWLLTNAAFGGLKPAPASRLRGACPHLSHSYARLRSISYTRSWRTFLPLSTIENLDLPVQIRFGYHKNIGFSRGWLNSRYRQCGINGWAQTRAVLARRSKVRC